MISRIQAFSREIAFLGRQVHWPCRESWRRRRDANFFLGGNLVNIGRNLNEDDEGRK
jgi:hypothetical protein